VISQRNNSNANYQRAENVPASVKLEGHKVLNQEKIGDYWSVLIEKA